VRLHFGEKLLSVVMKNGMQEIRKRTVFGDLWTKKRCGAFTPRELRGSGIGNEPALFAKNFSNIAGRESVCDGGRRTRVRSFLRSHREILSHVDEMA
jgi:hypothetical protein